MGLILSLVISHSEAHPEPRSPEGQVAGLANGRFLYRLARSRCLAGGSPPTGASVAAPRV